MSRLAGALLGATPGLLLWGVGLVVTGGGDGMMLFGMGGIVLAVVGLIAGSVWGSKPDGWLSSHSGIGLSLGLATVVLLGGWLVVEGSGPPDPILDAHDCFEIYELLGATGSQGEIEELPDLSEEQVSNAYERAEENPSDPFCDMLKQDLDAQANT